MIPEIALDLIVSRAGNLWQAVHGDRVWRCAVGRGGIRAAKTEGDGVSPQGCWPIRRVFYRADRIAAPETVFDCTPIERWDGWCDDPAHRDYNRPVRLPFAASHEELWRTDEVYDCVVVLGHNDDPVRPGGGSAIFLHVARPEYAPTAGCAAMARDDLLSFLARAAPGTRLCFRGDDPMADRGAGAAD